ncbi:hypothetical protein MPTA5024_06855 [Microbispora sp. ATCC PTA-5024]|nr:hypothetical protein MPTA5024_06855 [Microbispora sp. ATCC PTA-5024]
MNIGETARRAGMSRGTGPCPLSARRAGFGKSGGPCARTSPRLGTIAPG